MWGPLLFSVVKTQTNLIILLGHWLWFICLLGAVTVDRESDRTYQAPRGLSSPIKLARLPCSWQLLMLPLPATPSAFPSGVPIPAATVTCGSTYSPSMPVVSVSWAQSCCNSSLVGSLPMHYPRGTKWPGRAPGTTSVSLLRQFKLSLSKQSIVCCC